MKMNVSIHGVSELIKKLDSGTLDRDIDRITEAYATKMANSSAEMAPVYRGFLRNSIIASVRREKLMLWTWGSNLPYARRQEYEHVARKGFIRKAVWEHRQDYRDAIERRVKEFGK
ncbi:HK97 gp10 family phage protein [Alkalihalobacillus pseudalcaliphilus]|uniref:HK97 gp10 family phage protein n=1 Tax=Alkalihalobacillus pseudalcaliphilus TaxID=79884 RepID=UPI00069DEF51|nr:HK97 gp10 family phage protein [Alkalihalobacillus pseudalcaliphilus]